MTTRVKFGRRDFLGRGAAAAAAAATAVVPGLGMAGNAGAADALSTAPASKPVGGLEYGDFAGRLGQRFVVSAPERKVTLTLVQATPGVTIPEQAKHGTAARTKSFSLLFSAADGPLFESGNYQFSHPELGRMKLFAHPVGQAAAGSGVRYEVVFG